MFKEGDWALIVYKDEKRYLRRLESKGSINVKKEVLKFSEVIGKEEGFKKGNFSVFRPSLEDIILYGFKRKTQIIYPKDTFFIAFKLDIREGSRVFEFGTGSGCTTVVLSRLAGSKGEIYSFESSPEFYKNAKTNMETFGLGKNVKLFNKDFLEVDLEENSFDAGFVDVKEPWLYIEKIHRVLKKGRPVGFLLPTTNQISALLKEMKGFSNIEVLEIMIRYYKTVPERIRPEDTMIGHTGYLIFGRKI